MNWEHFGMFALTVVCGVLGWFARELWAAVQELRKDLHLLRKDMTDNYARRDDVREMFNQVLHAVEKLRDEFSRKVDR